MKIKCLERNYIVCGKTVVGEFKFSLLDAEFIAAGKAVCSGDDTFNEVLGKKLAYKRAKLKAINHFKTRLNIVEKDATRVLQDISVLRKYLNNETAYIEEYEANPTVD